MANDNGSVARVFAENCDRHWDAGLPVMPLKPYSANGGPEGKPTGKEPVVQRWQSLQARMPTVYEMMRWRSEFATGNLGLPLGPQSGLVAIDIDTDDPKLLGIINRVLPPSPWERIGQKGMVRVYKYEGQPIIRIKYRDEEGRMQSLIEMLGAGSQIVLPPSIHPKTGKPYWANRELVDVVSEVRSLPPNIDQMLRAAFEKEGLKLGSNAYGSVTDYISTGNRDNSLVSMAGLFARDVLRGQRTLLEACNEIEVAVQQFMQKTYGDNIDPKKGPQKLIEFLIRDVTGPRAKPLPKGWDDGLTKEQKEAWNLDQFSADHESWDREQILTFFNSHIEKTGVRDSNEQFMNVVNMVIGKLATNTNLQPIDEDQIINYMANTSGKKITVAAIRRQLASLRQGEILGINHAEIAEAAVKSLALVNGEIRYHLEQLWNWKGSAWVKLDDGVVMKHIIEEYGHYRAAARASDHKGILATVKSLVAKPLQERMIPGINFVNGFLTEDLELKEHHPDFGMTYTLPYPYKPELAGKCSRWQQMLIDYWGDDLDFAEKVTALGELMALTLFGKMPEVQMAVCLYGVGHSGKSRIMAIVEALMPREATTTLPPTEWGDRFGPAELADKLLNVAGELSEYQLIDSARFKTIVEGSTINAQRKNQPLFTFRPKAAHWFASNHLPRSRDSSDGFTRRWIFLCFTKAFPKGDRVVPNYDELVVSEEREAIAAWAVAHMTRLRNSNYQVTDPASSIETREHLENELNTVRDFLVTLREQNRIRLGLTAHEGLSDDRNWVAALDIYKEYRNFCLGQSLPAVSQKPFAKRMTHLQGQLGFKLDRVVGQQGLPIPVYRYITMSKGQAA